MEQLAGKVFVIVGGAGGIGRAVGKALLESGARVTLCDLGCATDGTGSDPNVVLEAARALDPDGERTLAWPLDVTAPQGLAEALAASVARFGALDGGVYCAGIDRERVLSRLTAADLDLSFAVHTRGAVLFTQGLGKALRERGRGGSIVLMCSATGLHGATGQTNAALSAGAIAAFTRAAAAELRQAAVRLNAVAPTARTRLTEDLPMFRSLRSDSLRPEHVAPVVTYLLAAGEAGPQGEVVAVAGGRVYAMRHVETGGLFYEGPPLPAPELERRFREVTSR